MQATDVVPTIRRIATNPRLAALAVTVVAAGYAAVEVVSLSAIHTTGPEVYGVLVAALAAVAGVAGVLLLASTRRRLVLSAAVLLLWIVVGLGGLAGTWFHATGVGPEAGPVDPRPRPQGAPLAFTALALVGGGALIYGQRGQQH
jgi:hypothetical protein